MTSNNPPYSPIKSRGRPKGSTNSRKREAADQYSDMDTSNAGDLIEEMQLVLLDHKVEEEEGLSLRDQEN